MRIVSVPKTNARMSVVCKAKQTRKEFGINVRKTRKADLDKMGESLKDIGKSELERVKSLFKSHREFFKGESKDGEEIKESKTKEIVVSPDDVDNSNSFFESSKN